MLDTLTFPHALRSLFGSPFTRRPRRRSLSVQGESLETRTMLTAYVLNSAVDDAVASSDVADGNLTLREAIIAANTNTAYGDAAAGSSDEIDRIFFSPGVFGDGMEQTIELNLGQLMVTDDLRIDGSDRGLTIDADNDSRHFMVDGAVLELGNLTLTGGRAGSGGSILANDADLVVDDVMFSRNVATGMMMDGDDDDDDDDDGGNGPMFSGGGAIYSIGGTLELTDSTFANNAAVGPSGSGGALWLVQDVDADIANTEFVRNSSVRAGGAIEIGDADLQMVNVDALLNTTGGPSAAPGNGGMLHVTGNDADVVVRGGRFERNVAASEGGALWNQSGSTMIVFDSEFVQNTGAGDGADNGGGALFNNGGTLRVDGATFDRNVASGDAGSGGAVLSTDGAVSIAASRFTGNRAERAGGGIELINGSLFLGENVATGNVVRTSPGNGGFYHVTGAGVETTVRSGVYTQNDAGSEGGAFWNNAGSRLNLNNVTITNNIARGADADNGGAGVFNNGGTVVLSGGTLSGNRAVGSSGSGGALLSTGGLVNATGTTFRNNRATRAGGAVEVIDGTFVADLATFVGNRTGSSPGNGGALHVTGMNGTEVLIQRSVVSANRAASEGGGLWGQAGSTLTVRDSVITGNIASGAAADNGGGGVFNNGGTLDIRGTILSGNRADGAAGSGGGLFSTAGDVTVIDSTLARNTANRAGGGIEVIDGRVYLGGVTIGGSAAAGNRAGSPNAAPGNGGGLHTSGVASVTVDGGLVASNIAALEGGGLWNQSGAQMVIRNGTTFSRNIANGGDPDTGGGALFNNGGRLIVRDAVFTNNAARGAAGSGGAIFSTDTDSRTFRGTLEVVNSTFRGNTANRAGGAIEVVTGTTFIMNSDFLGNRAGVPSASPGNGGALHVTGNRITVTLRGGVLVGNTATNQGGGLWNQVGATMRVEGQTHVRNRADGVGGAVYNLGNLTVTDSDLYDNVASDGGALWAAAGSRATLTNVGLAGNMPNNAAGPGRVTIV